MSLGLKCGEWKEVCVGSPMKKLFKGILRWLKSIHPSLSLSYFIPLLRSLSHIIYHSSVDTAPLWSAALLCTAPRLHWSRPSAVSASKFTLLCHISRWSAHMLHSHQEPFNTMWCTAVTHTEPWGTVRVELETRRVNEAEEMPLQLFSPALSGQYGQDIVKTVHVTCKFRWSATICHPFGYPRERERVRLRGRRGGCLGLRLCMWGAFTQYSFLTYILPSINSGEICVNQYSAGKLSAARLQSRSVCLKD